MTKDMPSNTVKGMRRIVPALGALVLLALAGGPAFADLDSGRDKLIHGDYDGARKDLRQVRGKQRATAVLLLAELDLRAGEYAEAERRLNALARTRVAKVRADARTLLAEVYLHTGRYDEARSRDLYRRLYGRLAGIPGVEATSVAATVPFGPVSNGQAVRHTDSVMNQSEG